jgi:hypothetical protein
MKKLLFLLIIVISLGCSREVKAPEPVQDSRDVKNLEDFFKRSDRDALMAMEVIEKHRIIQHLTHLKKMNSGGRKYYLLEKDSITEMIRSVTEGIYLDYILINRHGDIIYSRSNDSLFGQDVNSGYESTPLKRCFSMRGSETYFDDVSTITPGSSVYSLFVSRPVYVEQSFHGVLILQVDIKKIAELLERDTDIISREGIVRVTGDNTRILSRYTSFSRIGLNISRAGSFTEGSERVFYRPFNFRNISWIVLTRKTGAGSDDEESALRIFSF